MSKTYSFARRTDWPLQSNKLSLDLERLRQEQVPLLDLTESNPTQCGFRYYQNGIVASLASDESSLYRPTPRGSLEAREAICAYYKEKGLTVMPEQVFLTASTSEGYTNLFRLLVDPGGEVLFPRPSYPLFSFLGDLNDVHMDTYPLVYDQKWHMDIKALGLALGNDTKSIVVVNPNNPTGSFIQQEELKHINALCREHSIALICDEVFLDFAFADHKNPISLVGNSDVLTFVLGGISKTLGLPQMKLSWIIINGPKPLVEAASARLEVITDTYLSVNTPVQNALAVWLSKRKTIQKEIHARITQNLNLLKEHAQNCGECELLASQGGWYAILKIPDNFSEEQWVLTFLNKDHVVTHPGYFFDFDTQTFLVLSLLPKETTFQQGIGRILKRIKSEEL